MTSTDTLSLHTNTMSLFVVLPKFANSTHALLNQEKIFTGQLLDLSQYLTGYLSIHLDEILGLTLLLDVLWLLCIFLKVLLMVC